MESHVAVFKYGVTAHIVAQVNDSSGSVTSKPVIIEEDVGQSVPAQP